MRVIHLPAINRTVTLSQYVKAVKLAKANPDQEFKTGLSSWWPTKGYDVMRQFREGMTDRINEAIPYVDRGKRKQ